MTRLRCAILDDYINLSRQVADWSKVEDRIDITVFNEPFASPEAAAHALKGPIAIFGATKAKQAAQELQDRGRDGQLAGAGSTLKRLEEDIAKLEKKLRGYTARVIRAKSGLDKGKARGRVKKKRAKR